MSLDQLDEMLRNGDKADFHEVMRIIWSIRIEKASDVERLLAHIEAPERRWTWSLVDCLVSCPVERDMIARRLVPLMKNRDKSVVESIFRVAASMPEESRPFSRELVAAVSRLVRATREDVSFGVCAQGCLRELPKIVSDKGTIMEFLKSFPWDLAPQESHAFARAFDAMALDMLTGVASLDPKYALSILRRALETPLEPMRALSPVDAARAMAGDVPEAADLLVRDTARVERAGVPKGADAHTRMMFDVNLEARHKAIRDLGRATGPDPQSERPSELIEVLRVGNAREITEALRRIVALGVSIPNEAWSRVRSLAAESEPLRAQARRAATLHGLSFPMPQDAIVVEPSSIGVLALATDEESIATLEHGGEIWVLVHIGPVGVGLEEKACGVDRLEARRVSANHRVPVFAESVAAPVDMPSHPTLVKGVRRSLRPMWVERGVAYVGMREPLPEGKERTLVLAFDIRERRWMAPLESEYQCPTCSRRGVWTCESVYDKSDGPDLTSSRRYGVDDVPNHSAIHDPDTWSPIPKKSKSGDWKLAEGILYCPDILVRMASEGRWFGLSPFAAPRLPDGTVIVIGYAHRPSPDGRGGSDGVIARFPVERGSALDDEMPGEGRLLH